VPGKIIQFLRNLEEGLVKECRGRRGNCAVSRLSFLRTQGGKFLPPLPYSRCGWRTLSFGVDVDGGGFFFLFFSFG
jgi:hypothetical protein